MADSENIQWNFSSYTDSKGRTYIISYYNKWDAVKKQSRIAKRIHVGRLNSDTGEVSLSSRFLELHPEYVAESVFYEDNQLVVRTDAEVEAIRNEAQSDLSWRCDCVSYGLTYALWEVAKKYEITSALTEVFGSENGLELLRLGIYELCSHGMAMQNYEEWLPMYYLPDAKPLSSQTISTLLASVNQENMDKYFSLRQTRLSKIHKEIKADAAKAGKEVTPMMMAIDSTSISTYSQTIGNAAYGHAKQDDFLKQVNLTLCVDYKSGDVCYAYESEGSVNDMTVFSDILTRMQTVGLDLSDVLLVTDRGYSSVMNIQRQLNCSLKFLTGVRLSEDSVKAQINRYKASLSSPVFLNGRMGVYARSGDTEHWSSTSDGVTLSTDVYLHLYRDGALGERQNAAFMSEVQRLLDIKNLNLKNDNNLWNNYRHYIEQDSKSGKWNMKVSSIEKACRYNGYFAIRTNTISDPFDSLVVYRERNIVEMAFKQFKVFNDGQRLNATASSYKGKIFIHILAQTLRMLMCVAASGHKAEGKVLPGESFDKAMLILRNLQASRPAGRGIYIVKEISKKVRDLFDLFDVPYPKKHVKN